MVDDPSKIQTIIDLVKMDQSLLEEEDGFSPDFSITKQEENMVLKGNLRTALICLRHLGLVNSDNAEKLIKHIHKGQTLQKDNQKKQLYFDNNEKALKKFPLECCVNFPRWR